jgi:pimeloyl-ACP methyl ester carboxylesterase
MDVGHGHQVYWEECGNLEGKPALVIHGGPGSGATLAWRRYFDPGRYRLILFDQRGCGRSTPHAADTHLALRPTRRRMLADIEQLRELRGTERWLLFGGSWGVTLGLAYTEMHSNRVSEAIFFSITTGPRDGRRRWRANGRSTALPIVSRRSISPRASACSRGATPCRGAASTAATASPRTPRPRDASRRRWSCRRGCRPYRRSDRLRARHRRRRCR